MWRFVLDLMGALAFCAAAAVVIAYTAMRYIDGHSHRSEGE